MQNEPHEVSATVPGPRRLGWGRGLAIAVGAACLVLVVTWWAFRAPALEVETAPVVQGLFEEVVEDDGRARVRERVAVTLPWAGQIERLAFKEGQWVEPGEVMAWVRPMPPTLQDARTRGELEARGAAAQSSWQLAQRQVEVALVAWQRSALNAARTVALFEQGFVSRAQVDAGVLDLQREERAWQAARAAERLALHQLEQAQAALGTFEAVASEGRRALRATARVQVLRILQPHAAVLPAGTPLMEVGDARRPEVVVPLLSQEALRLRSGSPVRLADWSAAGAARDPFETSWGPSHATRSTGDRSIPGVVRTVEPAAATKISALGLEEQRVNVIIDPAQDLPPGDGYSLRVRFILEHQADAVLVPVSAVFPVPARPQVQAVFVVRHGRAVRVQVSVQARSAGFAWITEGVTPGDRVVVYPPAALADGSRVREVSGSK